MTNTRYITVLNVIACFFVIILHVFEPNFSTTPSWVFEELFRAIAYCAVPIFFMITGATLLDYRDRYDTKTYFKKRLLKTVIPFVFWSIVYFIINLVSGKINTSELSFSYIFNYFVTVKTNPIF